MTTKVVAIKQHFYDSPRKKGEVYPARDADLQWLMRANWARPLYVPENKNEYQRRDMRAKH